MENAYIRKTGSQAEEPSTKYSRDGSIKVSGYQEFEINKNHFKSIKPAHILKYLLMEPYLASNYKDSKIIDIGCSSGVMGFQLILNGFRKVNFVDHDKEYIDIVKNIKKLFPNCESEITCSKITSFQKSYDVGIALALIHWIYSYSEKIGTLDKSIKILKKISPDTLFIEWVGPKDFAIKNTKHIYKNKNIQKSPYNLNEFKKSLKKHYKYTKFIGKTSEHRGIWIGSQNQITLNYFHLLKSKFEIFYVLILRILKRVKNKFNF